MCGRKWVWSVTLVVPGRNWSSSELLKEAFLVSQGTSASVRPLTLPALENENYCFIVD